MNEKIARKRRFMAFRRLHELRHEPLSEPDGIEIGRYYGVTREEARRLYAMVFLRPQRPRFQTTVRQWVSRLSIVLMIGAGIGCVWATLLLPPSPLALLVLWVWSFFLGFFVMRWLRRRRRLWRDVQKATLRQPKGDYL